MKTASSISLVALTLSTCGMMAMGCVGEGDVPEAEQDELIGEAASPISPFSPPIDPRVKPGEIRIRAADGSPSNLCLDIDRSAPSPHPVIAWPCNGGKNQQWFYHQSSHRISSGLVEAPGTPLCLEVRDRTPGYNLPDIVGSPIVAKPCFPGTYVGQPSGQAWKFHADGTIAVLSDGGTPWGTCLDLSGANYAPGTPLITWTCTGGANQKFAHSYSLDTIARAPNLWSLEAFDEPAFTDVVEHFNVLLFGVPNPIKGIRDFYDVDTVGFDSSWLATVNSAQRPNGMNEVAFNMVKTLYALELRAAGNLRQFAQLGGTFENTLLLDCATRLHTVQAKLALSDATHVSIDLGAIMAMGLPKVASLHPAASAAMSALMFIADRAAKANGGKLHVDGELADFNIALSQEIEALMMDLHATANEIGQDYDKIRAFNDMVDMGLIQWPASNLKPLADEYEIGVWKSALKAAGYVVNRNHCAEGTVYPCRTPYAPPQTKGAYQLMKRTHHVIFYSYAEHDDICEHIGTLGDDTMNDLLHGSNGWHLERDSTAFSLLNSCWGEQRSF